MVEPWRNHLTSRQVATELNKFVTSAELAQNSTNIQVRYHGAAISEVAEVLIRLKEQLLYDNRNVTNFPVEFVAQPNNGMELLLRTLAVIQRQLHEAEQQNQSRISTLLHRNSSNKRRKSGIAEADCLECIKLLLQKTQSWRLVLDHTTNLEIILISVTSPQLDSKCYALELVTLLLDQPAGFSVIIKALTSLAGKNRDESRLQIVVSQLKHGLSTSKLHIQILIVRLLNKLISQAINLNYRVLVQIEAENAGFSAESLEKSASQHGRQTDIDVLQRELLIWKNSYLPLVWLQRKAREVTGFPVTGFNTTLPNGDVGPKFNSTDIPDEDAGSWRSRRMYNRHNAPVPRNVDRLRKKRLTPQEGERRKLAASANFPYNGGTADGMVHPSQSGGYFPTDRVAYLAQTFENPPAAATSIPRPRSRNTNAYPVDQDDTVGRTTSNPAYVHVPFRDEFPRSKSSDPFGDRDSAPFTGPMKRARSENALYFGGEYPADPYRFDRRNAGRFDGGSLKRPPPPRRHRDRQNQEADLPPRAHTLERDISGSSVNRKRPVRRESERLYHPITKSASRERIRPSHARSQSLHELHRIGEEDERDFIASRRLRDDRQDKYYRSSTPIENSSSFPASSTPINIDSEVPEPPPLPEMPAFRNGTDGMQRTVHEYQSEPPTTTISIDPTAPIPSVRRSRSDAADRVKLQGFSYLFPQSPNPEGDGPPRTLSPPPRRAMTPSPIEEKLHILRAAQARAASPDPRPPSVPPNIGRPPSSVGPEDPIQRRSHTPSASTYSSQLSAANTGSEARDNDGNVIYIPVRIEGTNQVLSKPQKSIMKTPSASTNQGGQYNYSYSTESAGPNGTRSYTTYHTSRERRGDRPRDSPRKGSNYGDDVEDALRKFDYLNEYDSSSRGSKYGAY